jgi:hypothetical protein
MGLTLERKLSVGLMIPIVSSEKRREYVPVGSTAASMPPTFSPETTEISLSKCHCPEVHLICNCATNGPRVFR